MRQWNWRKALVTAAALRVLAAGAVWADEPQAGDTAQVVVIREPGKPEVRCVIEQTFAQADGKIVYLVRDTVSGERLRVVDGRTGPRGAGPLLGRLLGHGGATSDVGMTRALASAPATNWAPRQTPTAAELAGAPARSDTVTQTKFRPESGPRLVSPARASDSLPPVQVQLNQLRDAAGPSQREMAAMVLAVSEARTLPEVVKALMQAARNDAAPSVRSTCVRCLYRLSTDVPDVVPVIAELRSDPSPEVARTAAKAMEEISKRTTTKDNK